MAAEHQDALPFVLGDALPDAHRRVVGRRGEVAGGELNCVVVMCAGFPGVGVGVRRRHGGRGGREGRRPSEGPDGGGVPRESGEAEPVVGGIFNVKFYGVVVRRGS